MRLQVLIFLHSGKKAGCNPKGCFYPLDRDFRFRRHSGHGGTCYWLDLVANDPFRKRISRLT
jgi:hypothetical protein